MKSVTLNNILIDHISPTPLCEIMGRNKSDKGSIDISKSWHNYTTFYYSLFKDLKDKPLNIFELGIGSQKSEFPNNMGENGSPGASLYGWREFFPNANIFGADIDKSILFKDERIKTFYCDSRNPEIITSMWKNTELPESFDIIIDDGLHLLDANITFFENSLHKLSRSGLFIIEDVGSFEACYPHIHYLNNKYNNISVQYLSIPCPVNTNGDNNLIIIKKNLH
jgi:hypothetical protein